MSKTTKMISAIIAIVAVIVIGYGLIGSHASKQESEPIKVGVVGHFSGKYADYGIPMKKGVELATDELNQRGGINGRKVELIEEDDNSDSNSAATAVNKLASIDKVDYVVSAQASGVTSAITPIAQTNKKVLMITLASAPDLTNAGDYIFRSVPSDTYQAAKMNEFINNSIKSSKVAGLYLNDSYGVGIKNIINSNKNINNVDDEMFDSGATDFRTQLTKIKGSGADTLVIVAHDEYPSILKQIKELKLNIKVIASETFKDDKILNNSGSNAEGVYVTFMADPKDYVGFSDRYQAKYNEKPSAYSMYAYDGMIALSKALEKDTAPDKTKSDLLKVSFDGASGKVGFSENRERIGSEYVIYQVKKGQFVLYEE